MKKVVISLFVLVIVGCSSAHQELALAPEPESQSQSQSQAQPQSQPQPEPQPHAIDEDASTNEATHCCFISVDEGDAGVAVYPCYIREILPAPGGEGPSNQCAASIQTGGASLIGASSHCLGGTGYIDRCPSW